MSRKNRRRRRNAGILLLMLAAFVALFVLLIPEYIRKIEYPMKYEEEIRLSAGVYGFPPSFMAAIVKTESDFDPYATSSVGARGLMQIMPDTGKWIARKLGEEQNYTDDSLYDAETSLRYGAWYLDFLLKRYDGYFVNAVAAYHSGQGTVDEWLKNENYSKDGIALTGLPDGASQTKHYVDKVRKAYEYYQEAYR